MLQILKKYIQIYKENGDSALSVKNIVIAILVSFLFYINGKSNNINTFNNIVITVFSILAIMFSGDCIQNELFEKFNNEISEKEFIVKKVIASNISFFINIILYVASLTILNFYLSGFNKSLSQLIKLLFLILLSLAIGNLLLIKNKKIINFNITNNTDSIKYKAVKQLSKQAIISIVLGLTLSYLFYDLSLIYLIVISVFVYIFSVLINKKY